MAGLREGFESFYSPDDDAVAAALRTGLVVADTNVLLSLYRFQAEAREQLFGALEIIGNRLWIPHQVALEFHRNRLSVIADQESYFSKTDELLDTAVKEYLSRLRAFTNRVALRAVIANELEERIRQVHGGVKHQVWLAGQANEIHLDNRDSDEVLRRLETLFNGLVGEPMKPDEREAARKEAKRRAEATPKIPPGYMDKDKPDGSGDYILWRQLINEASKRKLPVILITEDRKEDWFWREHGQTIGTRYELREEMQSEAGVQFLLMSIETFLIQAGKYLQVTVSPETVSQAKELPGRLTSEVEQKYQADLAQLQQRRWALLETIGKTDRDIAVMETELTGLMHRNHSGSPDEQDVSRMQELNMRLARLRGELIVARDMKVRLDTRLDVTKKFMYDLGFDDE